jgi:hypothetical protein
LLAGTMTGSSAFFIQGDAHIGAVPYGDGLRCISGTLVRLETKDVSSNSADFPTPGSGDPTISARSAALGDVIAAGSTRYYQVQYRNASLTFCPAPTGDTFNVTNAVWANWGP